MQLFLLTLSTLALDPTADKHSAGEAIPISEGAWKARIARNWPHHIAYQRVETPFLAEVQVKVDVAANGRVSSCAATLLRKVGKYDRTQKDTVQRKFEESACYGMCRYARFEKKDGLAPETVVGVYQSSIIFEMR